MTRWQDERPGSEAWLDLGEAAASAASWRWLPECPAVDPVFERERLAFVAVRLAEGKNPEEIHRQNPPRLIVVWGPMREGDELRVWNGTGGYSAGELVPALWHVSAPSFLRELCRVAWRDPFLHTVYGRDSVGPFWNVQAHRADVGRHAERWKVASSGIRTPACRHECVALVRCLLQAPIPRV